MDLRGTLGGITLNQTGRELEAILLMMLIYLLISVITSYSIHYTKLYERRANWPPPRAM